MTTKEHSIKETGLSLLFENQSQSNAIYSDDFVLEQKINEMWYEVPVTIDGNYGFNDIAYNILAGEISEFKINWEWLYGNLDSGKYRIIKRVLDFREAGDFDTYHLAAEFKI